MKHTHTPVSPLSAYRPAETREVAFRFEWPAKSGIFIKTVPNRKAGVVFEQSLQVIVPARITDRSTLYKQFKEMEDAKAFAEEAYRGARKVGTDFFASSAEERALFAAVLPELRRKGVSLADALRVGVAPAVTTRRTVDEVISELQELKRQRWENGDLRDRSWSDLTHRMGRIALYFQGMQVGEVTEHHVMAWAKSLKLGRRTVKNFVNVLSEVMNFAVSRRYLPESPLKFLGREDRRALYGVAAEESSVAIFTHQEAGQLLRTAEAKVPQLLATLALGLFAGVRSSEITQLTWADITLDGPHPSVRITAAVAKKRKIRFTPLCPTAVAWLRAAREGPVAPLKFYRKLQRLSRLAGVPWQGNAMRHSFASHEYARTGDAAKVSAALGHRTGDGQLFDLRIPPLTSISSPLHNALIDTSRLRLVRSAQARTHYAGEMAIKESFFGIRIRPTTNTTH